MRISAVIITKNEAANLRRCLESVKWVDEIVIIDSQSTDNTLEIAKEYSAKIYSPSWRGFGPAKKEGVERASGDWILSIDADEEVTPELTDEIGRVIRSNPVLGGYFIGRKTKFLGRWILHSGWYPDFVLRLFQKQAGNFDEAVVHEKVHISGEAGRLQHELRHYSFPSLEHYLQKSNLYTSLGAREAYRKGDRANWFDIVIKPPVSFIKHYILKQGFRDGLEGFIISALSAVAVLVKYAKLRELGKKKV
jgi:glycosyltransferase involved in cell wall biosynthesis